MSAAAEIAMSLPKARRTDKGGWRTCCPAHADATPSLDIDDGAAGKVLIKCRAGCSQADVIGALKDRGLWPDNGTANGHDKPKPKARVAAVYSYHEADGKLAYQVVRREPKAFLQRRPDPANPDAFIWNMSGVTALPYKLPELVAARDRAVVVVEGEKCADAVSDLGLVATTNHGGAGKWKPALNKWFAARTVFVLPDADKVGREHAEQVARSLYGVAASVAIVELPGLGDKGDVADWIESGGTADQLQEICKATLGGPTPMGDHAASVEHHPAALLDDVFTFLGRFVAYPSEDARVAHVLWIAHTHLMDAWDSTPRIAFLSPEPASGKTRALEITELLVPRPVEAVNVSPAYLFRKVGSDEGAPTLLFDEIDTVFGPRAKENEEIRGLLNAGHRRGAVAGRCVVVGKTVRTEEIPAYCAVLLAGLGDLPDTILTRSIIIRMRRRAPGERVEPYRRRNQVTQGHALRDRLASWAMSVEGAMAAAWPEMPPGIEDRDADVWEALLAIADAAGGGWPARARVAAVVLPRGCSRGGCPRRSEPPWA